MNPERWQQISRIFKSAISLNGEARDAYIAGQCGVDESLREEVEKLIESHKHADEANFIGGLAADKAAPLLIVYDNVSREQHRLTKGQQLGSYVVLDQLGAGGMGEVYLARDSRLDRTVALKVLSQELSSDKRRMQRFRQEAKVASSLNQPNILTIFEFGEVEGLTFLATEYIDGQTLRDYLHKNRLTLSETIDIMIQILSALDAAHEARIVHRDMKPENVMVRRRDRVVKVLDFGLAKVTEKRATTQTKQESDLEAATEFKTAPGVLMGTINYMSPEQTQAKAIDERTDIWSAGVMLYEMVTGGMPFKGTTSSHTIVQILENDPAPLTQKTQAKVPDELQRIVAKAMAKNPDERYQSVRDMLIDLRNLKRQLDRGVATQTDYGAQKGLEKKRVVVVALGAMLLVTATVFGINIWRSRRTSPSVAVSPPSPVATVPERVLTYSISVQKFRNGRPYEKPFPLPYEMNFEPDYRIRVNVKSPQTGHLYVLNEGPREGDAPAEFVTLFPSPSANKGSALLAADQEVKIPESTWIQFDQQQGVEKLWLVFSENAIPELEALRSFVNASDRGLIRDAAQSKAIDSFLLAQSASKPDVAKEAAQTTLKARGKLLVHVIRLEHH